MRTSVLASSVVGLLLFVVAPLVLADDAAEKKVESKAKVASVVIKGSMSESAGSIGLFGDLAPNLRDMVRRLDAASKDKDISAVVLKIRGPSLGRGKLEELRSAIQRTRERGKRVVAQLDDASTAGYLLACACDEIVMPESGTLMIPGIRAEITFFGGLFEKLGIEADMMQVGDYKGAAEPLTRKTMSKQFRAQYERLIDDLYQQQIETIAADRKLEKDRVKQLIDVGLFTSGDAKEAGLIDDVVYSDAVDERLKKKLGVGQVEVVADYGKQEVDTDFSGMMGFVKLMDLLTGGSTKTRTSKNKKIALVYAVGTITSGSSSTDILGTSSMGSDTIVKALRQAKDDKTVAAIVLRVDSPGGSALASDLIWREISQIEKPVLCSMSDTAASGGYYIAMGCEKIYAEPGTLTGSIGVVGGKLAIGGLMNKVGVNTEVISRGKNSGILSTDTKFTDSERAAWQKMMQVVYSQFTEKAAAGRGMKLADLEKLAGGRVWTGRQAKENGLVDELGTPRDALVAAKGAGGIAKDEKVELLVLPKATSFFDQLLGGMPGVQSGLSSTVDALVPGGSRRLSELRSLHELFTEPSVLIMPHRVEIK